MHKQLLTLMAAAAMALPFSAQAVTPTLDTILGPCGLCTNVPAVSDTGDELFFITDTDGGDDDASFQLTLEHAGFAPLNTSFIYDVDDPSNRITIFLGSDIDPLGAAVLDYNTGTGVWSNTLLAQSSLFGSGATFGFGLDSPDGVFFSQSALNLGGLDYMLSFATEGLGGTTTLFDYVLAWEDLLGLGDQDYNDHVFGAIDVAPIPLPAGLLLIITAFGGLAVVGRRRPEVTAA